MSGQPRSIGYHTFNRSCPILLDVEGPGELQVGLVVVVDELGDGGVVAAAEHAGRSGLGLNCGVLVGKRMYGIWAVLTLLLVDRLLFCARSI